MLDPTAEALDRAAEADERARRRVPPPATVSRGESWAASAVPMPDYLRRQVNAIGSPAQRGAAKSQPVTPIPPGQFERAAAYHRAFERAIREHARLMVEAVQAFRGSQENSEPRRAALQRMRDLDDEKDRLYKARRDGAPCELRSFPRIGEAAGLPLAAAAKSAAPLFDPVAAVPATDEDIMDFMGGR